jgi:hypothetical protein
MNTAYQHLGLTPDIIDNFALQANLVVDGQMQRMLEKRIRDLSRISERFTDGGEVIASKESVDKVITKAKRLSKRVGVYDNEWSPIELRILSYNLGQIYNDTLVFDYVANLLNRNWRNMFFNGLLFCLLNDWLSPQQVQKDSICNLLKRKLEEYDGNSQRFLALKNHANFLDTNGPLRMATLLVHQSKSVLEAPTIFGYKESTLSFSYFSDVILHYFNLRGTIEVDLFEVVLAQHQLDRTKKLILAMMVEQAEKEGKEPIQTQVSKFAQAILGDIALSSTWAPFPNATQEEIERLRKSQALVNQWNARKAINTFFELCVQDPKRKELWLKYVPFIYDFRIVGSKATKTKLLSDDRISDLIGYYYITTKSSKRQTSALVLFINNKVFVEFSDKGALYIYNHTHPKVSGIRKDRVVIDGVDELKQPSINLLIDGFEGDGKWYHGYESQSWIKYHDEGRLLHSDYWRERINAWMRQKLKIDYKRPQGYSFSPPSAPSLNETRQSEQIETVESHTNKPIACSKLLYGGLCRVEGHENGLYLRICSSNEAVLLRPMKWKSNSSIWIKKRKFEEIYCHTQDKEKYLGFLSFHNYTKKEIHYYPLEGEQIVIVPLK